MKLKFNVGDIVEYNSLEDCVSGRHVIGRIDYIEIKGGKPIYHLESLWSCEEKELKNYENANEK